MIRKEHLEIYDLTLTACSPLHIGSGNICAKTDYLFEPRSATVRMIDPDALFDFLYSRNLVEQYENFIFSGDTRMYRFLRDCRLSDRDISGLCLYQVDASDALDDSHSLKEIHTFMRDSSHRVYIPGSSVKGALRTALLACLMMKEKKGNWPNETSRNKSRKARQMQTLEGEYLHTLSLKKDKNGQTANDPVNSILRGLSVSDSTTVSDEDMILVGKIDVNEKGESRKLPLCRECIRPGTTLHFKLTLDHSALPTDFDSERIMEYIRDFYRFYKRNYISRFTPPQNAVTLNTQNVLILGGGSGYFAKTLSYPYLGMEDGLRYTAEEMSTQFYRHGHDKDVTEHNVSPHMMKYGKYQGYLYPYGVCEVKIT